MKSTSIQNDNLKTINELKLRIEQLEKLVDVISRGKMAWQTTFDVITDPVVIIDQDYKITRANQAFALASQTDVRHITGKKCYEVFAGATKPCRQCPAPQTLKQSQHNSAELDPFVNKSGHYHVNVYAMKNESGKDEMVLHYRSIAEEKVLQHKLFQSEKMAAVGTLAGGIAHEINNPLGAILAFTQLVIQDLPPDHPCQNDLHEIEGATKRCRTIVKDLLNFSRQSYDEAMQPVDLNQVIEKSMALVSVNAKNKPIDIVLDLQKQLPLFQGHFHKLQQVLINLVSNAIFAMKECGGGTLTLRTYSVPQQNRVVLSVQDTGSGIEQNVLNKIFDPYFTTKAQGEGTGLGLPITYKIVQEHKGVIEVKSQVGQGTEFILFFPYTV